MKTFEFIDFELPTKERIILKSYKNPKKKFVASASGLGFFNITKIRVNKLFFEFPYNEQVSIIYHELWHYRNNLIFELKYLIKKPWLIFYSKPIYHNQEFNADLNALKMTNKKDTLNMLKKLKEMINKGILPKSHGKTHPSIDERIKRIKGIK
jgi:hypothetical protein